MKNHNGAIWNSDEFCDAWNDYADDDCMEEESLTSDPSSAEKQHYLETIAYIHHEQDKHWKSCNAWLDRELKKKASL